MYDDGSSSPLLRKLPRIRRARDYRLYTDGYSRVVDLWQYGGQAVLGHTVPHQLREFKNNASRGLFVPFPHHFEGRLEKAFLRLFPGRVARIYKNWESMKNALAKAEFEYPVQMFLADPALGQVSPHHSISLWRPFLHDAEKLCISTDILIPVLPFSWMNGPGVLLVEKAISEKFPPPDLISPVVFSGLLSSIYALIRQMSAGTADYSELAKGLTGTPWQQRGIYLSSPDKKDESHYERIFLRFFEGGFLLPPERNLPLILPVKPDSLSPGELSKLKTLLTDFGD